MTRFLALAVALILAAVPARADGPIQIFLAHAQEQIADADTAAAAADEFRRQVADRSGGRLRVEILPNGLLGGNRDIAALVEKGVIHSALVTLGGVTPIYPPLNVIQTPFAFHSLAHARAVLDGPFGKALAKGMREETAVSLLGLVDPDGFHILTNSDRPVATPEDMWGLRIRAIPGSQPLEAVIKSVGAIPVKVASRDEISALSGGMVDGQMNSAVVTIGHRIDGVQRYATMTNHLYIPYAWIFNTKSLEAMSPEHADIIRAAALSAMGRAHALAVSFRGTDRGDAGLRRRLEVTIPSAAALAAFEETMRPPTEQAIVDSIGGAGETWQRRFRDAVTDMAD